MKTTSRIVFVFLAVLVSANLFAQNSVNDLFNTYVIVPAQQRIQVLTDELNNVNAQIQDLQDQLAAANSAAAAASASSDELSEGGPLPVSPLSIQITDLQLQASDLQNTLNYWQTQLAAWLSFNTQQQEQYLIANNSLIETNTGENVSDIITNQNLSNRFGPMPDPNNPSLMPVFVSTGNAEQDALLVQQWLFQHGLIDSIGQ